MMFSQVTTRDIQIFSLPVIDSSITFWSEENKMKPLKKMSLFTDFLLSEMMQTENLSITYQPQELKFSTETVLTEKFYRKVKVKQIIRISEIIDRIIEEEELFREINRNELLETLSEILDDISIDLTDVPDEELSERIRRILALEAISGLLKEMSPEQIKAFDNAVKRRPLFE